ncbi:MAG: phospho-N-acetylmuramoyl-pentapeptide-transferase [Bacteroidia bacterium]|nr:phospho-N-acetylmuramoyl-pentapeptide-transferase [Bacteroidia bacterium]MCX7652204.1 phospho-N-acetylmuramoyl-pentapeptide-transferase [Bacteroidia bacterium]MDW8416466.1 phospho-N-acetylmuramoyl-pentapeptide-transferase [Bacteroidia bacterium]
MLNELMRWLDEAHGLPGMRLAQYISFRTLMAAFTAGAVGLLIGPLLIRWLKKNAFGETIRSEGPATHIGKKGTPTMGGLLILISLAMGALLWGEWNSAYLWALLGLALWLGTIGFLDDWLKRARSKKGLPPRLKLLGQVGGALWLTMLMFFEPSFHSTRERVRADGHIRLSPLLAEVGFKRGDKLIAVAGEPFSWENWRFRPTRADGSAPTSYTVQREGQTLHLYIPEGRAFTIAAELFGQAKPESLFLTNLPFVKNQEIAYGTFGGWEAPLWLRAVIYGLIVLFILTATSNAFNLTDGLDGLAVGVGAIAFVSLASFAYFSSNRIWADYFMILYLPHAAEVTVFAGAVVGACIAFLWYNGYPAQVFMGDTGSLMLGGLIGAIALMVKKELLLPLIAGIPLAETLSVMLQVAYFRYTKRKYGEGRRIFRMSPLHHHFELSGWHEAKVVIRFWIVAAILNALAFITLKIR